jgi:hypothetical protein
MCPTQPRLALVFILLAAGPVAADDAVKIESLRVQKRGATTYFEVKFASLPDFFAPSFETTRGWWTANGRAMARLPRLVPQDDKTASIYYLPSQDVFVGKLKDKGTAQMELLYAKRAKERPKDQRRELPDVLVNLIYGTTWENVPLTVDFTKATTAPSKADLQWAWGTAQAKHFGVLEAQSPEFGFFGFARTATERKYNVFATPWLEGKGFDRERAYREAYSITSGAAAITESLQLERMRQGGKQVRAPRTIDVNAVQGITIAEHPWEKLLAGKQPTPEPLAKFVPQDNYYVHFKNLAKFIELGELAEKWGGNLTSLYDLNSRDYQVKQHYEKQLCIKSTWLGKTLGPFVVRGMALTGNDPYLREGSDLAVLFHTVNPKLFLSSVEQFVDEARKEFGEELKETKYDQDGITVEKFATALREVSLHRAVVGDVVIYANSPVGMARLLDTYKGKRKALGESMDFQYMRTVMRLEDKLEDGFVFLSDAFIRQLVGPASKIKERRRIEALTSMAMVTNAALFHAWETGELPADHAALLKSARLTSDEVYTPEGKGVVWDSKRKLAVADAYNTQHFATPLVELPIDLITLDEEREYNQFRQMYLGLWRQYFDPVGIRIKLTDAQIRVETYILPLIASSQYSFLRTFSGDGVSTFDMSRVGKDTILNWYARFIMRPGLQGVGDQITIRLDDDVLFDKWVELYFRRQLGPQQQLNVIEREPEGRLLLQMPITLGAKIGNEQQFDGQLQMLSGLLEGFVGKNDRSTSEYKGVSINHIKFKEDSNIVKEVNRNRDPGDPVCMPSLHHAKIDGFWYISFREEPIRGLIDEWRMRGDRLPKESDLVTGNSAIQLVPSNAVKAERALKLYQEWESHCRSVANCSAWQTLFRTKVLPEGASKQEMNRAALHWFGYIPVSPDRRPYVYVAKFDEVENVWHGSPRNPQMRGGFDEHAPLAQLLDEFRKIRADLRFQEDGVNTVVTIERKKK